MPEMLAAEGCHTLLTSRICQEAPRALCHGTPKYGVPLIKLMELSERAKQSEGQTCPAKWLRNAGFITTFLIRKGLDISWKECTPRRPQNKASRPYDFIVVRASNALTSRSVEHCSEAIIPERNVPRPCLATEGCWCVY